MCPNELLEVPGCIGEAFATRGMAVAADWHATQARNDVGYLEVSLKSLGCIRAAGDLRSPVLWAPVSLAAA
jgi:hypothetical protein